MKTDRDLEMKACLYEQGFYIMFGEMITIVLENYIIIKKIVENEMIEKILGDVF